MTAGRFIVFEGGEGCGKSTQARLLAEALGPGTVLTREPGATEVGARLRTILLSPETGDLDPRTEALLMAADRAQHVAEVVAPALAAGHHVVSDRYAYSSIAYQGYGRGLSAGEVRMLSDWAGGGLWPDAVVFLDLPDGDGGQPRSHASAVLDDRFETAGAAFFARVVAGFREMCEDDPSRWIRIDGSAPVETVAAAVRAAVGQRLQLPL